MKKFLLLSVCVLALSGCKEEAAVSSVGDESLVEEQPLDVNAILDHKIEPVDYQGRTSLSGEYLASRFAQNRDDWKTASKHLETILKTGEDEPALLKMSMILAAGSGDIDRALVLSRQLADTPDAGALTPLFEVVGLFKARDYKQALGFVEAMPQGGLSEFVHPLLAGWAKAANGVYDVQPLISNTVHLKHAVLIADFMGKKEDIPTLLDHAIRAQDLSVGEMETVADTYIYIGALDKAVVVYEESVAQFPDEKDLSDKLAALKAGQAVNDFKSMAKPEHGVGLAMADMARLLYRENSMDSAKIFSHFSRYLNPDDQASLFMLAAVAERSERYMQASEYYMAIKKTDDNYLYARRKAAEMMQRAGDDDAAIAALQDLAVDDVEALISIGNIYRGNEDFKSAVKYYDQAYARLKKDSDLGEYWHLYYVRGMAHEQDKNWDKAEKDLQKALEYRPDNAFVLNYLGYAWADQGKHLDQSLEMIRRALALEPTDGYITDSLGWVYYRMGRFDEAVPYLERAVELLPYDPIINDHLGDSYWRVGRKLEARFQWIRAKNHSEDEELKAAIDEKMNAGLAAFEMIKRADADGKAVSP